jgi:hypothetical protein
MIWYFTLNFWLSFLMYFVVRWGNARTQYSRDVATWGVFCVMTLINLFVGIISVPLFSLVIFLTVNKFDFWYKPV